MFATTKKIVAFTALAFSAQALALQLPDDGAFQVKVLDLSVNGEVLVKNGTSTKADVPVPKTKPICIKKPSDWEATSIWTGSYRVNCFNGTFDEAAKTTKLKTQCGTLASSILYEVEQKLDGANILQTETETKENAKQQKIVTITKIVVRPAGKC